MDATSFEYLVPHPDGTTDVMLHSLGSNNETIAARFQANLWNGNDEPPWPAVSWHAAPTVIAYTTNGGTDANGMGVTDVWVASKGSVKKLYSYSVPGIDAFARPGLPPPVLDVSPDGLYLAAGWAIRNTIRVFRLSDGVDVSPPEPSDLWSTLWSENGHTLYVIGRSAVGVWVPGSGVNQLPNSVGWVLQPNFAPDGSAVAFTAVTANHDIRSYVYDVAAKSGRLLVDRPRSGAMFVKSGWIWLLEESPCQQSSTENCFDPTTPDGTLLAMNLSTGQESVVGFPSGDSPFQQPYGVYLFRFDLWPRS